jgi:cation diffusion facilitator CzcD-associated flavoprotein CzcO
VVLTNSVRSRARGRSVRVAIVGAGLGGIAMAVKLKQAGFQDFTVFEQSAGPGGVWFDNTYPGCEVDTASISYSYSFIRYDWSKTHCSQPELRQYTEDVIDHFGVRPHFRFSTRVDEAVWDEDRRVYRIRLESGEEQDFELLVSAVGMLNVPRYPEWPGMGTFRGPMFHSARWEHEHDLRGKRVAVVGTGCTAAQIVPNLAPVVGQLYLYQREPGWVLPKDDRVLTPEERAERMRQRVRSKLRRWRAFQDIQSYLTSFTVGSEKHQELTRACLDHIESSIEDPAIRELVTPNYPYGCKRPIKDSNFYPALNRDNVELVPKAVAAVTPDGLVDADGVEREVDLVVLAVGFKAADYLVGLRVVGPSGVSVHDQWAGDPKALAGLSVAGVPNFFMVYGPNTNGGGPITAQQERQAEAIVSIARRMRRWGYTRVDTKPERMERFVRWIDRHNNEKWSTLATGCNNYFFSSAGRNVTQWPLTHLRYALSARSAARFGMQLER